MLEASPLTLTTGDVHNLWLRYAQLLDKTLNLLVYRLLNELGSFTQIALCKIRNKLIKLINKINLPWFTHCAYARADHAPV